jgi:hypothetical protein
MSEENDQYSTVPTTLSTVTTKIVRFLCLYPWFERIGSFEIYPLMLSNGEPLRYGTSLQQCFYEIFCRTCNFWKIWRELGCELQRIIESRNCTCENGNTLNYFSRKEKGIGFKFMVVIESKTTHVINCITVHYFSFSCYSCEWLCRLVTCYNVKQCPHRMYPYSTGVYCFFFA